MAEVSTSVLSIKEDPLQKFYDIEASKTDYFHIDVMDGKFVENDTRERMRDYSLSLSHTTNVPLEVHLMVENIKEEIDEFIDFNPQIIIFHVESIKNKEEGFELIKYIKDNGIKVGMSVSPDTEIEKVYEFLPYIHMCLVMTVVPGKGGQKLIEECLEKVKKLKKYIEENDLDITIEADGGINLETAEKVKESGEDILVAGTAIVDSKNYAETIKALKE